MYRELVLSDRALYLPTCSHLLIVNKPSLLVDVRPLLLLLLSCTLCPGQVMYRNGMPVIAGQRLRERWIVCAADSECGRAAVSDALTTFQAPQDAPHSSPAAPRRRSLPLSSPPYTRSPDLQTPGSILAQTCTHLQSSTPPRFQRRWEPAHVKPARIRIYTRHQHSRQLPRCLSLMTTRFRNTRTHTSMHTRTHARTHRERDRKRGRERASVRARG